MTIRKALRLRSSTRTSVGQVRENNEDNVHLWMQDDAVLAIVADGMGGAAAGEEASRLAVAAVEDGLTVSEHPVLQLLDKLSDDSIADKMREMIRAANLDIMNQAAQNPDLRGMGTTVTLAFVRDMHAIIAHVGDSRAYLVGKTDKTITQITADHSFVEALVAAGYITRDQAENHPMGNVLYRALGQTDDLDIDVYHCRLRSGDRVILCSDGLTRHVRAGEIADIALQSDEPAAIAESLVNLTNERGGEDNVSVAVILLDTIEHDDSGETQGITLVQDEDDTIVLSDSARRAIFADAQTNTRRPFDEPDSPDGHDVLSPDV